METLTAYPQKKEESKALKAFFKSLKIRFESNQVPYSQEFINRVEEARKEKEKGLLKRVNPQNIWESIS